MPVLIYLLKLRFPANKSVAKIICKRYGVDAVKGFGRFERLDFKILKKSRFGVFVMWHGLTPKFLNCKLANSSFKNLRTMSVNFTERDQNQKHLFFKIEKKYLGLLGIVLKR